MTESVHSARLEAVQKALVDLSANVSVQLGELVVFTSRDQIIRF